MTIDLKAHATAALQQVRHVADWARRDMAAGSMDEDTRRIAGMMVIDAPTCPACDCIVTGASPWVCPGCGGAWTWSVEIRRFKTTALPPTAAGVSPAMRGGRVAGLSTTKVTS